LGIVSSLGNNVQEVSASLRQGRSGIAFSEEYAELGLRSRVYGPIRLDPSEHIDRRVFRFMGDAAAFGYIAMAQAIADAGLTENEVSHPRTGLITGSGGASNRNFLQAAEALKKRGIRGIGPYMVPRTMGSTTSANLSTAFKIKGASYSISSACSTSAHCIGNGCELIQLGKQDVVFAGGGEEIDWTMTMLFDAMGALSSKYNETPSKASRPYDRDRDGFVISGGGGMMVLEALEHAKARGARIFAERCMRQALATVDGPIDYINTHGTSTQAGDVKELEAVREVFGTRIPSLSSTKSLTGHALGAAGVHEAIYSLIMMREGFIAGSANIEHLDPAAEGMPIVPVCREGVSLERVMSNSFGFGGTNAALVFERFSS
jgi:3-oxoacyl-[acyl-carrier-protein] synthase-1